MELITSTRMTSTWDNLPDPASQGHPCWDYRQEFKHSFKQNPPCTRTSQLISVIFFIQNHLVIYNNASDVTLCQVK